MTHRQNLEQEFPIECAILIRPVVDRMTHRHSNAGKHRTEDDSSSVPNRIGEMPGAYQALALSARLFDRNEGKASIFEGLKSGGEGEGCGGVHGGDDLGVDAVLFCKVEVTADPGQLRYQLKGVTGDKLGASIRLLDDSNQILVQQSLLHLFGQLRDEILSIEDSLQRIGSEDLVHTRQSEADSCDHIGVRPAGGHRV